jgi:hypothetical protein
MTGNEDELIRRRLRRAADEVLARQGDVGVRRHRLAPPGVLRWAAIGVPVTAVVTALALLAVRFIGSEQPASLYDASTLPSSSPSPEPSSISPAHPNINDQPLLFGRPCQPARPAEAPDEIEVGIQATQDRVARIDSLTFSVRMRNGGRQPVTNRRGGQEYDILVRDADGADVWLWSHDVTFGYPHITETYAPGEEHEASGRWNVRANCSGAPAGLLQSGTYHAFGIWITQTERGTQGWWSEPISFEIR